MAERRETEMSDRPIFIYAATYASREHALATDREDFERELELAAKG